jgi:hypothetical protein
MPVQGTRSLYKAALHHAEGAGEEGPCQRHDHYEAGCRASGPDRVTRPCLYKGAWTLRVGDRPSLLLPLDNRAQGAPL